MPDVLVSGVLRQAAPGMGWEVLDNETHHPRHVAAVTLLAGALKVWHPCGAVAVVAGPGATVDETLSRYYTCGASIGLDFSFVKLWRDAVAVDPAGVFGAGANLFFTITLEVPEPA